MRISLRRRLFALAATFTTAAGADGATYTWTSTTAGNWTTTGSWQSSLPAPTPGVADDTINFNANITSNITVTQNTGGTVTAGTLTFQDATASNNWTVSGTGANTLTLATTTGLPIVNVVNQTATLSLIVAGSQGFTKTGVGTLSLSNTGNSFTGDIVVNAGRLQTNVAGGLGTGAKTVTVASGGSFYLNAGVTIPSTVSFNIAGIGFTESSVNLGALRIESGTVAGSVALTANARIHNNSTGNVGTISGAITGAFELEKTGNGTVAITGNNSANTETTLRINRGSLRFNAATALPGAAGAITINSSNAGTGGISSTTLSFSSLLALPQISTASTGVFSIAAADANNYDFTTLTGYTALGLGAAGNFTYTGTYTPIGDTYRLGGGGGTLTYGSVLADAAGPTTRNLQVNLASAVTVTSAPTYTGTTTVLAGGTLQYNLASSFTWSLPISGAGNIAQLANNTLTFTAANTFTGTTTIAAGTVQLTGGDNRLATTSSVAFTGSATLDLGTTSQTISALSFATSPAIAAVVTGSGSLTVNGNTDLQIGSGGALGATVTTSLDLSTLASFTYNAPSRIFRVGLQSGSTNSAALGNVGTATLAGTNSITASTLAIADISASSDGGIGTLNLGTVNALNVTNINVGASGRSDAFLQFASGLTNPTATIRGTSGGNSFATSMTVGNVATFNATTWGATVDFSTGTLDANITTITVGQANTGGSLTRAGTQNSTFIMGAGVLNVTTMNIASMFGGGSLSAVYTANGIFELNHADGVVNAGTINMATSTITATGASKTVTGTLNLLNGTLNATTIQQGTQSGSPGTVTVAFNFTAGTLGNIAGSNLTVANTVPITLVGTGDHTFRISGTQTGTVNSVISGTGSPLTKDGTGTLVLNGVNTYTGATTVATGTLNLGVSGALPTTSPVSLDGGTLAATTGTSNTTSGTLDVTANSILDFGGGGVSVTRMAFGDSSAVTWIGTLTVNGYTGPGGGVANTATGASSTTQFFVGSSFGGLTPDQLAAITFTGYSPLGATQLSSGEVVPVGVVPEPVTILAISAAGLGWAGWIRRRRTAP